MLSKVAICDAESPFSFRSFFKLKFFPPYLQIVVTIHNKILSKINAVFHKKCKKIEHFWPNTTN